MILLQVNTTASVGSTGRIAEDIGQVAMAKGVESYIAYGQLALPSQSHLIRIGSNIDIKFHGLKTRLLDRHGFGSTAATKRLVVQIRRLLPDIIHMHNLHGYYLNIEILFNYLSQAEIPVIWTFHDSWPFTGHCTFFEHYQCEKWKTQCGNCPNIKGYPASWGIDQSSRNFKDKKRIFNTVQNLTIVTPSYWLANLVRQSFLKNHNIQVIHNGVDLTQFFPHTDTLKKREQLGIDNKRVILGVASIWDKRKGLTDFVQLSKRIAENTVIILVGLSPQQIKNLPQNGKLTGIVRTESIEELCILYSLADVFVNPTYLDNFPNTNIEALACGTPIITYKTGGSPEAVGDGCGFVVEQGNLDELQDRINIVIKKGKDHYQDRCRKRAETLYDKNDRYQDYLNLYQQVRSRN